MKKIFISIILLTFIIACQQNNKDIYIIYDNDPHCSLDGYPKIAHIKDSILNENKSCLLVSAGDFFSGNMYGTLSKGYYPIKLMNTAKYDIVTLGNHEFDYSVPRLIEMSQALTAETICCNFKNSDEDTNIFKSYSIKNFKGIKIAFIGVCTPATITSSAPVYFKNADGTPKYSFCTNEEIIYNIQNNVTKVRESGADYVIILSHLGDTKKGSYITSRELIEQTEGIDAVIDGHDHHRLPCDYVLNSKGDTVILTSTGAYFRSIGILKVSNGKISTRLIDLENINANDKTTYDTLKSISSKVMDDMMQIVGESDINLYNIDNDGNRLSRVRETTIGDFLSDAFRFVMKTDIGIINGGAIRANIQKGDIRLKDIYEICPFQDRIGIIQVSGKDLSDALEMGSFLSPKEFGGFLQISGLKYDIDTTISSSVELDEQGIFVKVNGRRKIKNIQVLKDNGEYQDLIMDKTYTIAGPNYILLEEGNGIKFNNAKVIINDDKYDIQVIQEYIQNYLPNKTITYNYGATNNRINYISGKN